MVGQKRIHEISTEMCSLLDQQTKFLNGHRVLSAMSAEVVEDYAHRSERLNQLSRNSANPLDVPKKKSNPKIALRCPTCGAAPGEKCELPTGQQRTNPSCPPLIAADR